MKSHEGEGLSTRGRPCKYCPKPGGVHHHGCCVRSSGKKRKACRCVKCCAVQDTKFTDATVAVIVALHPGVRLEKLLTELCRNYGLTRGGAVHAVSVALAEDKIVAREEWTLYLWGEDA